MRITPLLVVGLALAGCVPGGLSDERHPTGSSTLATSANYNRVFSVNSDAGTVSILDANLDAKIGEVAVGSDPVRLARAGDLLFVTVRGTGEVVALRQDGDDLSELARISVGSDPYGVVADESGSRVFVAVGLSGEVVEISAESLQIVNRFGGIPGQPRWVALHPSARTLYVGSAFGGTWTDIDLESGDVNVHEAPGRDRFIFTDTGDGTEAVPMSARITGDLTVSPFGDTVAIPMLYVDNTTSVDGEDTGPMDTGGYSSGPGVGRTNPTVLLVDTSGSGAPDLARTRTIFSQAVRSRVNQGDLDTQNVRSYLSSLTFSPDGLMVLGTMEGSEAIVAVPLNIDQDGGRGRNDIEMFDEFGMTNDPNFDFRGQFAVSTDAGPRGVIFVSRDRAAVDTWLDRSVSSVPVDDLQMQIRERVLRNDMFGGVDLQLSTEGGVESADLAVDASVDHGRRLFFSATDGSMAAHSGGISCATCHFDGRNDGLTWTFAQGQLQTPSLAGEVSATEPVTWMSSTDEQPISVAMEVRLTSRNRMGGSGADVGQSQAVADYIDFTPYPKVAAGDLDVDAVARGREIFHGSAECSSCHFGEQYTDSQTYAMAGLDSVRTPTLRGVAATGPYLHDGRAESLDDVVTIAESVSMGKTNHLSASEKADLVAFLKSL